MKREPLGSLLCSRAGLAQHQLRAALQEQRRTGELLGDALVRMQLSAASLVADQLAAQLKLRRVREGEAAVDVQRAGQAGIAALEAWQMLPVRSKQAGAYALALCDPQDLAARDYALALWGPWSELLVLDADQCSGLVATLRQVPAAPEIAELTARIRQLAGDSSGGQSAVQQLVDQLLLEARSLGGSDLHLEPGRDWLRVRYRIDGQLREQHLLPIDVQDALVNHIKIRAGLDIAERRLPQDGRMQVRAEPVLDVRISTLPGTLAEGIVARLLPAELGDDLAMLDYPPLEERLRAFLRRKDGLLLLTGPTGSGKTTTAYACLGTIDRRVRKLISVEDPPEYALPGVHQIQINEKAGLDFPTALRSILRHDPDVIFVGEIRDVQTAAIACRAAMTGHLVISTLHTPSASAVVPRLIDMGVEPYLLAAALSAVLGQQLVIGRCSCCASEQDGCPQCAGTGQAGRKALFEYLEIDERRRTLISAGQVGRLEAAHADLCMVDVAHWRRERGQIDAEQLRLLGHDAGCLP